MIIIYLTDSAAAGPRFPYPRQHYDGRKKVIKCSYLFIRNHCFGKYSYDKYIYKDGEISINGYEIDIMFYNSLRIYFDFYNRRIQIITGEHKYYEVNSVYKIVTLTGIHFYNPVLDQCRIKINYYNMYWPKSYKQYTVSVGCDKICLYYECRKITLKERDHKVTLKRRHGSGKQTYLSQHLKEKIIEESKFVKICHSILNNECVYLDNDMIEHAYSELECLLGQYNVYCNTERKIGDEILAKVNKKNWR